MAGRLFTRIKCTPNLTKCLAKQHCLAIIECSNIRNYSSSSNISHCQRRTTCFSPRKQQLLSARFLTRRFATEERGCIRQGYRRTKVSQCRQQSSRLSSMSSDTADKIESVSDVETSIESRLSGLCRRIKQELSTSVTSLQEVSHYYFDGQGKYIRPMIVLLMASTCNNHTSNSRTILTSQDTVAMISEMIHTASLIHDDVIDSADTRRGKVSVNKMFGDKNCILGGDYILSCASLALAKLGNPEAVKLLAEVVEDLVRGEFMQLGSKEDPDERFAHYLKKTYKKTASLIANSCKAVALFGECSTDVQEIAYQYGKHVGIAFQLVDDVLDFVASEQEMGKPTAADLQLGLATAPVLFACEKFPDLNSMIMRRFKEPGDVQRAREAVYKSEGISRTYSLANQYAKEALRQINKLPSSVERDTLINLTHKVVKRRR